MPLPLWSGSTHMPLLRYSTSADRCPELTPTNLLSMYTPQNVAGYSNIDMSISLSGQLNGHVMALWVSISLSLRDQSLCCHISTMVLKSIFFACIYLMLALAFAAVTCLRYRIMVSTSLISKGSESALSCCPGSTNIISTIPFVTTML